MNSDEKLKSLREKLTSVHKAENRLLLLHHLLEDAKIEMEKIKQQINKEYRDLQHLEKISLAYIYHSILGNIGSTITKEKEEYLMAVLRYDHLANSINLLYFEKDILVAKISNKEKITEELKDLLLKKENEIKNNPDHTFNKSILQFNEKIDHFTYLKKEISDARLATNKMKEHLSKFGSDLKMFDPWLHQYDYNLMYTFKQTTYLKNIRQVFSMIDYLGLDLNRALSEIAKELKVDFEYAEINHFFDSIHKSTIDGWKASNYLHKAKLCIKDNLIVLENVLKKINEMDDDAEYQINVLKNEKRLYLENI